MECETNWFTSTTLQWTQTEKMKLDNFFLSFPQKMQLVYDDGQFNWLWVGPTNFWKNGKTKKVRQQISWSLFLNWRFSHCIHTKSWSTGQTSTNMGPFFKVRSRSLRRFNIRPLRLVGHLYFLETFLDSSEARKKTPSLEERGKKLLGKGSSQEMDIKSN